MDDDGSPLLTIGQLASRTGLAVADVAAAHIAALDAQVRSLRLTRAVLSAVARRASGTEEMTPMNKLARLSAAERRQIIEDFIAAVFAGLGADPGLREKLRLTTPELPDEPTPQPARPRGQPACPRDSRRRCSRWPARPAGAASHRTHRTGRCRGSRATPRMAPRGT